MQTVLEELRKADIRDLEGSFFFENSPDLWRFEKDDSRTIAEVRRSMSDNFRRFVEDLKKNGNSPARRRPDYDPVCAQTGR